MKFDLRFITTLILIVLIVISFVFIILETLYFSNRKKIEVVDNATNTVVNLSKATANTVLKVKTAGDAPDKLVEDTQYYRYGSLLIHVLAMISGAYMVYSG